MIEGGFFLQRNGREEYAARFKFSAEDIKI